MHVYNWRIIKVRHIFMNHLRFKNSFMFTIEPILVVLMNLFKSSFVFFCIPSNAYVLDKVIKLSHFFGFFFSFASNVFVVAEIRH